MNFIKDIIKAVLYKPLFNLLVFLVWLMPGNNIGLGIILLTVIIRFALYGTQKNSIVSQKKMQEIQPELEEIKQKYAKDQQAQAQATMDLYKRNNINPFSSCLPLLIQLPILIVLYKVFTVGLTTERFDLLYNFTPRPEVINTMFLGMDLANPSIILAIIAGALQFIQSKMMMPSQPKKAKKTGNPTDAMMNSFSTQMVYMFPIMTVIIAIKLPGALPLYWIVTTLFMIIQQLIINRTKNKIDIKGISVKVRDTSSK